MLNRRQMKLWVFFAVSLAAAPGARAGESLTVKQYDVTWTFDKPVQTGQFVTGDWWVVPAPGETAVAVVKVDPAPTTTSSGKLINGSMVNPKPWGEAFDQRTFLWCGDGGATYPVTLKVGQSLVSSVCFKDAAEAKGRSARSNHIKYIAVLTCLDKPALPTDFRPPYVGTDKPIYSSVKLRRELLPDLALPSSLKEKDVPNLNNLVKARFSRPWYDFANDWCGVYESDYGREKAVDVGGAGLLLCLNKKDVGDKEPLLIGLVQTGIDLYGALINGKRWGDDCGTFLGRKFPILFAGLMLDNQEMLEIGKKYPPETAAFQEDVSAFIVTKADTERQLDCMISGSAQTVGPNTIGVIGGAKELPGCTILKGYTELKGNRIKITKGPGAGQIRLITASSDPGWKNPTDPVVTCTVTPSWEVLPEINTSFYQVLGYQEADIGHAKFGAAHWVTYKLINRWFHQPECDNPSNYQAFSQMNKSSRVSEVLAARILGLKEAWKQDAVFQLIDEYMVETAPGGPFAGKYGDAPLCWGVAQNQEPWPKYAISGDFIGAMWNTYRSKYGDKPKESSKEEKKLRIFTCGHSFHANWLPGWLSEVEALTDIKGHDQVGVSMIGGSPVIAHWNIPDEKNQAKAALLASKVDVLTLSPMKGPDDGIDKFARFALEHNPNIRVTMQELWLQYDQYGTGEQYKIGPKPWNAPPPSNPDPKYAWLDTAHFDVPTAEQVEKLHAPYFKKMDDYVVEENKKIGKQVIFVVPVGQAVVALRRKIIEGKAPGISKQSELFLDSLGHPKSVIQALAAYCHFAVIYQRSPIGLPLLPGLAKDHYSQELNLLLQQLAWDAVTQHPLSGCRELKTKKEKIK